MQGSCASMQMQGSLGNDLIPGNKQETYFTPISTDKNSSLWSLHERMIEKMLHVATVG